LKKHPKLPFFCVIYKRKKGGLPQHIKISDLGLNYFSKKMFINRNHSVKFNGTKKQLKAKFLQNNNYGT